MNALVYALALVPILAGAFVLALVFAPEGYQDADGFHLGRHPDDGGDI